MPVWSPMRHILFQSLAKHPDIHLTVFFEKETISHRPSWNLSSDAIYDWKCIGSYHPKFLNRYRLIPLKLPRYLKHYQTDVIIVVCLTQAVIALLTLFRKKTKILLWTGENAYVLSRRSYPKSITRIRRMLYPFLDGFGCYSKETMAFLKQSFHIPDDKTFRIPQCIDNQHFLKTSDKTGLKNLDLPKNKVMVLTVGRLIEYKGIDHLISAWHRLPDSILQNTTLCIAGTGPARKKLELFARQNSKTDIKFLGFVEYNTLPELYSNADIFILPSLEDNWGFVINEAMASGLPVLCSINAIAKEMILPGKNGYLFDPLNQTQMIATMITLFKNRDLWVKMGQYGQITASKNYSVQAATAALVRGIKKILTNKGTELN